MSLAVSSSQESIAMRIHDYRSFSILACSVMIVCCPSLKGGAPRGMAAHKVLETTLSLAAVGAAANFSAEIGSTMTAYWNENIPPGESLYSATFSFEKSSWADWLSDPDIFLVLEREGGPAILVPEIRHNWDGSLMIIAFRCPTLPPNSRCVLRLMDDDSVSNEVWNSILGTRATLSVDAAPAPMPIYSGMMTVAHAGTTIQILDTSGGRRFTLDSSDTVAAAAFIVPERPTTEGWMLRGDFRHNDCHMGVIEFAHAYTNPLRPFWKQLVSANILFWGVLSGGLLLVIARLPLRARKDLRE